MKIGIELQPCLKNKSGIGVYTYELVKRMQEDSSIQLNGHIFNFMGRNALEKDLKGLNFETETCKLFPYGIYRRVWHYMPVSYHHLFKREVELTHFFNFIVPPRIKGKVINTIHDLTFEFYPETMDERNLKRIKQDLDYSIQRSDCIITISESTKKDLIEVLGIEENKIEIVYPGVDYKRYSQKSEAIKIKQVKEKYGLPEQYILYMGTLEPRKNIPTLIKAFSGLKKEADQSIADIKLVLAGKKGWLFEEIFNEVSQLGLEEEVIFTDYVAEEDKAIIYQLAQVFVFPSLYEGFGIPVLEAMAAGVPVITSCTSSLPEVAGPAAILVEPKDDVHIAESLYKLLKDEAYRGDLVTKGRIQAQQFNWDESAKKLSTIYKNILSNKKEREIEN